MPYFQSFPIIPYDLTGNPTAQPEFVRNVFFRLKIIDAIQQNSLIYYPYYIKDGETPEHIAYKYYKDAEKHWLVMMVNNVINPFFDWPLSDMSFLNYINAKYSSIPVTLYDNTSNLPPSTTPKQVNGIAVQGTSFLTGLMTNITSVSVLLSFPSNITANVNNHIAIGLYNDATPNNLGTLANTIVTLTDTQIPTTPTFFTFNTNIAVNPNSRYWIGFKNTGTLVSSIKLNCANNAGGVGVPGSYTQIGVGQHQSTKLFVQVSGPGPDNFGNGNTFQPFIMQIQGTSPNNPDAGQIYADTAVHHYTLTTTSTDSVTGLTTNNVVTIDQNTYNNTPATTFQQINLQDGSTVSITTTTGIVYVWDYEHNLNESKKQIQLLDKTYATQIDAEFNALTAAARSGR